MTKLLLSLSMLIPSTAFGARAVMEGIWASSTTVYVSTPSRAVIVGSGGICFGSLASCQTAPGTGDVSSNGNNTMSGTLTVDKVRLTCPTGFFEVHAQNRALGCMQTDEEGSDSYAIGSNDCFTTYGGRFPTIAEFCIAGTNFAATMANETDDNEYTAEQVSAGNAGINQGATAPCRFGTTGDGGPVAYRCFIPR